MTLAFVPVPCDVGLCGDDEYRGQRGGLLLAGPQRAGGDLRAVRLAVRVLVPPLPHGIAAQDAAFGEPVTGAGLGTGVGDGRDQRAGTGIRRRAGDVL
ncbi:hypothetical protein GCM10023335_54690 [Streptomyces siamensis]|uniref:Uncharacterized protein n=1 Tax=Streptomyces siamensis TaxID=1274986 RepID=A0ABP9J6Y7_9ACTN